VTLDRVESAAAADLKAAAAEWLSDGVYVLEVTPFPEYSNSEPQADRTAMPEVGAPPEARFPSFERTTLSNGVRILFAERRSVPQVTMSMMFDAGTAADQFARPGTANLAMGMMDEGTTSRSALEISEQLALLGASVGAGADLDMNLPDAPERAFQIVHRSILRRGRLHGYAEGRHCPYHASSSGPS